MNNSNTECPGRNRPTYLYVSRPKCPSCGSTRLRVYKSRREPEAGAVVRYSRCADCGERLVVIAE